MRGHLWMTIGLVAGLAFGLTASATQLPALLWVADHLRPLGTLFINLLSMVVIPLVAAVLFTGVAGLGGMGAVGRLGLRTLAFFFGTTATGILIGFAAAVLILPFAPITPTQQAALRQAGTQDPGLVRHAAEQIPTGVRFLVELIPANPVRAAVDGALLPLIVFVAIAAVATASLGPEKRAVLTGVADGAAQALIRVVQWVLLVAPLGVFALVAPAVAQFGWSLVKTMGVFIGAVLAGLAILIVVVYLPLLRGVARLGVRRFARAAFPAMLMGFSTTSSLAALPAMLDGAERDLKISRGVAGFVLPLGTNIGRAGSALYQAVAVLFVARLYGTDFGLPELVQAGAAVFLAALTTVAVPSSSVVSLAPAFTATALPLSGLTLLIGLDRIPDMFRTTTNVLGDLAATAVVATLEGERLR